MNESTELMERREEGINPGNLLAVIERAASDPTCDVGKMERLLEMALKIKSLDAEGAFNVAMAQAQAEMPAVFRDASNPSTNSRYTRLESLHAVVVPVVTKHGFSMSFGTDDCPVPGHYRVTCLVGHRNGFARTYKLDLPNDSVGAKGNLNKTAVHGAGSSMSYGRRYLTLMIFNVSLTSEDDDGNKAGLKNQPEPGKATEGRKAWFLQELAKGDIETAKNYAHDKGWLAPDETINEWPLDHVPITWKALADLWKDVGAWAKG